MREVTLDIVEHPQFIEGWQRVDHPVLAPLVDGDATAGWEGDPRLVVYLHNESQTFALWRLEHDGEYRPVAHLKAGQPIGEQEVGKLIRRLVEIDQRRGWNPGDEVMTQLETRERHQEVETNAFIHDFADKFHYALSRSHLPGVDISRVRNTMSRR